MNPLHRSATARGARLALIAVAAAQMGACGNLQVRPLATGVPDRPAYALAGRSLDKLRDEAQRLCPSGAEVLRSAQRLDGGRGVAEPSANWYGRWWQTTQATLAPPDGQAQLVVLCQSIPGGTTLAALPPPAPPRPATASLSVPGPGAAAEAAAAPDQVEPGGARPARKSTLQGLGLAPVGEGDLRSAVQAPRQPRSEPAPATARSGDLRGGMTAALPAAAVRSGGPGRAPSAATVPGQARTGADAGPAVAAPASDAGPLPAVPARSASAPILTY